MSHLRPSTGAILAVALGLAACAPGSSARIAQSSLQRDLHPSLPAGAVTQMAASNNALALDLYGALRSRTGNLVFSPMSISLALAMPYAGARSETESQMARTLHFDLPPATLQATFDQLSLSLTEQGQASADGRQPMQLHIANATWAEQTLSFLPQYLDILARDYGAGIRLEDFVNRPDLARQHINAWVAQETQDKIQDLIPEGGLGPSPRMVLVNAIYFKADWQTQFDPSATRPMEFTLLNGSSIEVPTMSDRGLTIPYVAGGGYQAVELPYQGGSAVMDVIVPDHGTFGSFEGQLDAPKLNQIVESMQATSIALSLPKFEFGADFDLGDKLTGLGMADAFDPNRADFSGMTGGRDLFISGVLHQALVAVDEKGTEAAAATSVIMAPTLALRPNVTLRVDRPFIFVIRDIASGQILFIGRVLDPTQP